MQFSKLLLSVLLLSSTAAHADNREAFAHTVVIGIKGAAGGAALWAGLKSHPEIRDAKGKLEDAQGKLGSAEALVTVEERTQRIARAKAAFEAGKKQMADGATGNMIEQGLKTAASIAAYAQAKREGKDDWNARWQADQAASTVDGLTETDYEKGERLADDGEDALRRAERLQTATPAQREEAIRLANLAVEETEGKLKAAKTQYGPKGAAKAFKVLGVVAGGFLIADALGQVFFLLAGEPTMFPIGSIFVGSARAQDYKPSSADSILQDGQTAKEFAGLEVPPVKEHRPSGSVQDGSIAY